MSSLDFTGSVNSLVNAGSATSLDDLAAFTFTTWIYPTSLVVDDVARIYDKGITPAGFHLLAINNSGNHVAGSIYVLQRSDGGANLEAVSDVAELTVNTWNYVAVTGSFATTAPIIYTGTLSANASAITGGYYVQTAGTVAIDTTVGEDAIVGNRSSGGQNFTGYIASFGVWNRILTLGEIIEQQWRPHFTSGCKALWFPGMHGASAMPDLSGNSNNGSTFTSVSVAKGVPIGLPFGFDTLESPPDPSTKFLNGAVSSASTVAGGIVRDRTLAGTVSSDSSTTSGIVRDRDFAGSVTSASSVTSGLTRTRLLAASVTSASSVVAGMIWSFGSLVSSASSVAAGIVRDRSLAVSVASNSSTGAGIFLNRALAGSVDSVSSVTAGLTGGTAMSVEEIFRRRRFGTSEVFSNRRNFGGVF